LGKHCYGRVSVWIALFTMMREGEEERGKTIKMRSRIVAIMNDRRIRASIRARVKVEVKECSGERKNNCS
jgi:hypothetical protein